MLSAPGSVARRAIAVLAITLSSAIGFSLLSSSATGARAPFLTQAQADERYVARRWVVVHRDGRVLNTSDPAVEVFVRRQGEYDVIFGDDLGEFECAPMVSTLLTERFASIAPFGIGGYTVRTINQNGLPDPTHFALQVTC